MFHNNKKTITCQLNKIEILKNLKVMKMKRTFIITISLFLTNLLIAQSPASFNYQAVLRDSHGNIKANTATTIIINILQGSTTGTSVYSETQSVTTDNFGLVTLGIGKGTVINGTFSGINWGSGSYFVKVTVDGVEMGTTQLLSVPYSLYSSKAANGFSGSYTDLTNKPTLFDGTWSSLTGKPSLATVASTGSYNDLTNKPQTFNDTLIKLTVQGKTSDQEEALFEVKNKNGQTVFAVYNEGVRIYVDDGSKGTKGGFAIGGFNSSKASPQNFFVVNPDSIRAYINSDPGKATKGGFAIGGFSQTKTTNIEYLRVTPDSTRVSFDDISSKGSKGGFAIGGFDNSKGVIQDFLTINTNSIRMYINDSPDKGSKGGFAIGGFDNSKSGSQEYFNVTRDSSRIYFDDSGTKGSKGGFAIGGFNGSKAPSNNYLLISTDSTNFYVRSQGTDLSSTFNILSVDPNQGQKSLMKASTDTIGMAGVLNVQNNFTVAGNIGYTGEVSKVVVPVISTAEVNSITQNTAISGGNITDNGGAAIIVSGVCWSTTENPTIADNKTKDGKSMGTFSSTLTGLTPSTTYYVRAYATNSAGTGYGTEQSFTTNSASLPLLTTLAVTSVTQNTASSGGNITSDGGASVTARGVCYGTSPNPTIAGGTTSDGTGAGSFTSSLTELIANTTYYIRAYAVNSAGTAYGNELSFTTSVAIPVIPTLFTASASSITQTTAMCGGDVMTDGGATITARGVCWSTSQNPTISDSKTSDGTGLSVFSSNLTGLTASTTYYVRSYASNSAGTGYGNQISFTTTSSGATVQDIDGNTYNIVTIGTQTWMAENLRTTKYNDGTNITIVTDQSAWMALTTPGYSWYNNDQASFKTPYGALYNWYALDATSNGSKNVCPTGWHVPYDDEWTTLTLFLGGDTAAGSKLKEIGLTHWQSPNSDATNQSGFTAQPAGCRNYMGMFMDIGTFGYFWSLTDASTTNAIFRRITNINGVVNRTDIFKKFGMPVRCLQGVAVPQVPSLYTAPATSITQTTASTGGNVVNDGGSTITERGVCYSTSPNPTIAGSKTSDGTGSGMFTSNLFALVPNTVYYIRAYATNSTGTAYGNMMIFVTASK
jgi:uncharacterized protein (TIGR02145 family)